MKIGVFDSGIGGLTVLRTLINKYPNNEYLYYGDTINLPYGEKDKENLLKLTTRIIHFFEDKEVDLIIIACGTISSTCYLELQQLTNIPIYDIITPTINYLNNLDLHKISVWGTKRTIDSHLFKNSLVNKNVLEIATSEFVPMIENRKLDLKIIENYCLKIIDYEVLVLGCTHYPLLIDEIKKKLPNIKIINMANCLVDNLNLNKTNNSNVLNIKINLYFTKLDDKLKENVKNILNCDYNIQLIR